MTETNVRHILIAPNEIRTMDEAQILASEIREKLAQGEGFIQLARKYSDDPGSALSGGDLGWTEPGVLVPIFEETMNNYRVGPPIKRRRIYKSTPCSSYGSTRRICL